MTRPLNFELRHPLVVAGDTPDDGVPILQIEWSTEDSDEQVQICLNLSLNEYVKLASAIDVGRDIAYGENTNEIWWIWCRALAEICGMSCEDVADCIENDANVLAALLAQLSANGFSPNTDSATADDYAPLPNEKLAENLLPTAYDCSTPAHNMSIARAIVRELNESAEDLFENIELTTNPAEAVSIVTDGVPVAGTANNVVEFADWLIQTAREMYQAAYNQTTEDTISCAIFCHLETDCTISLDEIIEIYSQFEFTPPETPDDLQSLIDWSLTVTGLLAEDAVAAVHSLILYIMRFGESIVGTNWNDLANVIRSSSEFNDYSYDDCDDCPPEETVTDYWSLFWDFGLAPYNWTNIGITDGNLCHYVSGNGWEGITGLATTVNVNIGLADLGAQYVIRGFAVKELRRGGTATSNDYIIPRVFPNANWGGTFANFGSSANQPNGNEVIQGAVSPLASAAYRSLQALNRVSGGAANPPTRMLRVYQIVVWGLKGAGDTKPPNSIWAGNTLPATVPELFPS